MSTSNQHQQRSGVGGRRQPFGSLNANTIPSAKAAKGTCGSATAGGGSGATDGHKKDFKGVLSSIVKQGKKKERRRTGSSSSLSSNEGVKTPESPTKKTRVTKMEEEEKEALKPSVTPCAVAAATSGPERREISDSHNQFAASDVAGVFRSHEDADTDFWNDEMEDMLELKQANPILDDSVDYGEGDQAVDRSEGRMDPSKNLAEELEQSASGEPISWSDRVQEDGDVFKIHVDKS